MKQRIIITLIAVAVAVGLWQLYKNHSIDDQHKKEIIANCKAVTVTIDDVYKSGQGVRMFSLLRLHYTADGKEYQTTLRRSGYVKGQYKKGDTLALYVMPNRPDSVIDY